MKRKEVWVHDLSSDTCLLYMDIEPVTALVNTYMLENNLASQLHNDEARSPVIRKIVFGKKTMAIGDWAVKR